MGDRLLLVLIKRMALALLLISFLVVYSDVFRLNPAQRVALPYRYSLLAWEADNLLSKWTHRLATALPWNARSAKEGRSQVLEYFRLGAEARRLGDELSEASAEADSAGRVRVGMLESELEEMESARVRLRNDVEEVIESTISAVLADEGIAYWRGFVFPPVDIRLSEPPRLLVTSPRDRIERTHDVLLDPGVDVEQIGEIERSLRDRWDLSGLVTQIGGVATYPASLVNTLPLQPTLELASHEWLHHYLAFRPLGRNVFSSPEMQTLNETLADIVGREIGGIAYERLDGTPDSRSPGEEADPAISSPEEKNVFDFDGEMRVTRKRVDELLSEGKINEAEAYMEERRQHFVANGFHIRVLNQAYFAFYGTYAESPTSVSPIADQLHEFRNLTPDLKSFVAAVADASSYGQFLDALERLKVGSRN
jgi:hypothetical protein